MKFRNKYRIESNRLPYWDYTNPGMYFVTICTKDMKPWFGRITNGEMKFNAIGKIAKQYWIDIPEHFDNIELDEWIIMPNHIHGIIHIKGEYTVGRHRVVACDDSTSDFMSSISPKPKSLSTIIRSYKSAVTRNIRKNHNPEFCWQTRFYDHVIRSESALGRIQYYIQQNPQNWDNSKKRGSGKQTKILSIM